MNGLWGYDRAETHVLNITNNDKQVGALKGYESVNPVAMALWEDVYPSDAPLIALTDTFSSDAFFTVRVSFC